MKAFVCLAALGFAAQLAAAPAPVPATTARRFLADHCVRCHGPEKQKGDVRLDDLTGDIVAEGTRWAVVLDSVRDGKMPPPEAKPQPSAGDRAALAAWGAQQFGAHAQRRPNLGNLVPHDLLFGPAAGAVTNAPAPAPRLWRLSSDAYFGWVEDVAKRTPGLVPPFTANPDRGIKDFATLGRVDAPTTEILLRNAEAIVDKQTAFELVDGKPRGKNDAVREFIELMQPAAPSTPAQVEKAVQKQFALALARRAEPEEVARLLALYDRGAASGNHALALKTTLTAVLLRADAIFRAELGGPDGMLTPRETAAALSAALLHRRDARLFDAAEKGQITTRAQLAEHIRRLLDDPKTSPPRVLGFFREYFEYGNAPEVFKDRPKDLMHEPKQHVADTDRLILHLVATDKDVFRQLLTTPLAFVNVKMQKNKQTRLDELAPAVTKNPQNNKGQEIIETLYGLPEWTAQQPFTQTPGTRLGVLMQPSWLIAWSENFNNDIVRRGRFIRERLLGGTVPDLPIGVIAMIPDERHRTLRDRVTSTTKDERCWKCHQHMDRLGLPFENFDHYSRLITAESVLDRAATAANVDKKGKPLGDIFTTAPLDTTGSITGTGDPQLDGPVKSPHELVTRLANSDRVRQVWVRHAFRYYLGRNETLADAPTLQAADRAYLESGGSFKALLVSLLTSDSFLKRSPTLATSQPAAQSRQ
jgi:cytochrome c553